MGKLIGAPGRPALSRRALLRRAGIALAAVAAVPLVAACGARATATVGTSSGSNIPTQGSAATSSAASTTKAGKPAPAAATATANAIPKVAAGTLLFSTYGSDEEQKVWDQAVAAFEKVHPDVKIQHDVPPDFYNKVLVEAAGGTPSDVMMFETKRMPDYITKDFFLALDKYISTSSVTEPDAFFPFSWRKGQLNGKQYGVPWDEAPAVLFYNVDMFHKLGVDLPPTTWATADWNWQKFIDVCQKLTTQSGANATFAINHSNWWIYCLPWVWSNGADVLNADFTKSTLTDAGTVEGFQYVADLRWKYHVDPKPGEQKNKEDAFNTGHLAMVFSNAAYGVVARDKFTSAKWDVAPVPTGKGGAFTRSPADAMTIAAESKLADKAWTFCEWTTSPDGLTILMQQGRVPTRTEVAYGAYLKQQPAINWKLIADASKDHQRNQPVTDKFQEMDKLLSDNWNGPVFDKHTSTPQQFAQKSDGPLNALLAQATYRRVIKQ